MGSDESKSGGQRQRIAALGAADLRRSVFGSRHHQWALGPVWPEHRVVAFERAKRVELPAAFRRWLLEVGATGAFPGHGLFEPGTIDTGGGPKPFSSRRYGPLGSAFLHEQYAEVAPKKLPGALPLCDLGCGRVIVLVTAGEQRGRVWVDGRLDGSGVVPESDLLFDDWIDLWLSAADAEVVDPWEPPPHHANEPDTVHDASDAVDPVALAQWLAVVRADLSASSRHTLPGRLGGISTRQSTYTFDQGPSLANLLRGEAVKEQGVAVDLFRALAGWPPWTGLQVDGLFLAWVSEDRRGVKRDYLGRTAYFGHEGISWTVRMTARPGSLA